VHGRQQRIREALQDGKERSVAELATKFEVSAMTIRRDLAELEELGEVVRTHGGAVLSRPSVIEFRFQQRGQDRSAAKRAIANAALALLKPGLSLTLDTGTTTLELAKQLATISHLKVLTSSLAAASVLYGHDHLELVLLGGMARKGHPDLYGELTEDNVRRFRVDIAFLGADALLADGLYTGDANVARVSKAIIAGAQRRILLADSSKFSRQAFRRFATWPEVSAVITDDELPESARAWLSKVVPELHLVPVAQR
jgi:DeoR/GlpR family transcriptional regulator of sugar metabolism